MAFRWTQPSGYNFGSFAGETSLVLPLPVLDDTGVTYQVISGMLPDGIFLIGNELKGSGFTIKNQLDYEFCIRATTSLGVSDRTFYITITDPNVPTFITPSGNLDIGTHHQLYVLDQTYVNYQIQAIDLNSKGRILNYYIASGDGALPPGLTLSDSGVISGYIKPAQTLTLESGNGNYDGSFYDRAAYDFGILSSDGFDNYLYDDVFYDYNVPSQEVITLNVNYQFKVTITDGVNYSQRLYRIFVVGNDELRADSTTTNGLADEFTADSTYVREPVWITNSNLGIYRANNYITIPLALYDTTNVYFRLEVTNQEVYTNSFQVSSSDNILSSNSVTVTNTIGTFSVGQYFSLEYYLNGASDQLYQISAINDLGNGLTRLTVIPDLIINIPNGTPFYVGSLSSLPTGTTFDITTGTIYGIVPYQPAVSKVYKFTLTATRFRSTQTDTVSASKTFNISIIGDVNTEITWLTDPNLGAIPADYICAIGLQAVSQMTQNLPIESLSSNGTYVTLTFSPQSAPPFAVGEYIRVTGVAPDGYNGLYIATNSTVKSVTYKNSTVGSLITKGIIAAGQYDPIIIYELVDGSLPPGITLNPDGELIGTVNQFGTSTGGNYTSPAAVDGGGSLESTVGIIDDGDSSSSSNSSVDGGTNNLVLIPGLITFDRGTTTFDKTTSTFDRVYTFTINASDQYGFSIVPRTFKLTISTPNTVNYSNIVTRPFLKSSQRTLFQNFITDPTIFVPTSIYRANDPNFGIQENLTMLVYAGIETREAAAYISAMGLNTKRKRFQFGNVKKAIAIDPNSNLNVYEVVYIQMIDPLEPNGKHLPLQIKYPSKESIPITADNILYPAGLQIDSEITSDSTGYQISDPNVDHYYPNSITNWRTRIETWTDNNGVGIAHERNYLPLWMRSIPQGEKQQLDYTLAIPLCFCKPGTGDDIIKRIQLNGFDFKNLDYTVDRYILNSNNGINSDKYLAFRNDRITI